MSLSMNPFVNPHRITKDVAEILRPPRRVSVSDCAKEVVYINTPGGYSGLWDPSLTPYMIKPMNMLKSRVHEAVVFVAPARCGKTQALLDGWLAHCITADPGDIGFYFSTQGLAYDYRKRRIERLHNNSPRIREKISNYSHDTTIEMVVYRNGMILNLGWPTSSQFAQRDLRYVAMSDYDSFPTDIAGEGEPFTLAKKRIQVAMSAGMALVESSPKKEIVTNDYSIIENPHIAPPVNGGILTLYNRGDRQRWYWTCERCNEPFEAPAMPAYKDSEYIEEAAASAHVYCTNCGFIYYPKDKKRLNANGRWYIEGEIKGRQRYSSIASFWLLGCAAAMQKWESIVANYLMAKKEMESSGDEKAIKATLNTDQGMPYLPLALQENTGKRILESRIELSDRYIVPNGVRCLLAAVDVQHNRFEVMILGFGVKAERWIIDRFTIKETTDGIPIQPPIYLEHWHELTQRVVNATYRLADGRELRVYRTAVDMGGYHESHKKGGLSRADTTQRAYDWWRQLKLKNLHHRVHLIKGASSYNAPVQKERYPESNVNAKTAKRASRGDVPVVFINTNKIKDTIAVDLQRDIPGAGFIHIPDWLSAKYRNELTAEQRTAKGWVQLGVRRNETLDLMVYTYAIWLYLKGDQINWERLPAWAAWAMPLDKSNPELLTSEQRRSLKKQHERNKRNDGDDSNDSNKKTKRPFINSNRNWLRR